MTRPLISCLCVTRGRVALLRRAVECFANQAYEPRELVIVADADDAPTLDYAAALTDPRIRNVVSHAEPRLTLGALRNLAMREARGDWVAQWDDDDWHAPARLERQWQVLADTGQPACLLYRWLLYDVDTGRAFVAKGRGWEGSLVGRRDALGAYPDVPRGEDTAVLFPLVAEGRVAALDEPALYIYTFHGANTWSREHWEAGLLEGAQPLGPGDTAWVRERLGIASPV